MFFAKSIFSCLYCACPSAPGQASSTGNEYYKSDALNFYETISPELRQSKLRVPVHIGNQQHTTQSASVSKPERGQVSLSVSSSGFLNFLFFFKRAVCVFLAVFVCFGAFVVCFSTVNASRQCKIRKADKTMKDAGKMKKIIGKKQQRVKISSAGNAILILCFRNQTYMKITAIF